ncbi:hypothetical protein N0B28_13185 [Pseudomonas sp. SD17-1]|uniref:hypothetical protein n=1 Tax=unclassified Pseudomonas TaxID=196821 RepID=UPI0023DCDD65|nr:hypothetical protein [Pseudomonas sp. SD17-1]WEJ19261.1 hypothetical protein N0B28_13185 [Pseudomonas sp. SD17-1]
MNHSCEKACGLWTPETCSKPRQLFIQTDLHGLTSFLYIDEAFADLTGMTDLDQLGRRIRAPCNHKMEKDRIDPSGVSQGCGTCKRTLFVPSNLDF